MNVIKQQGLWCDNAPLSRLWNRTAATVAFGDVGIIDSAQADAASTSWQTGLSNVVAVSDGQVDRGCRKIAICQDPNGAADDAECMWVIQKQDTICRVKVNTTTDITKGDLLIPVEGQVYLVKAPHVVPTLGTDSAAGSSVAALLKEGVVAEALESRTANDTGLIYVRLIETYVANGAD